ncbi:hypothetical protein MNB_SV-15-131 [hydrothermal vent metagenome]|uniref:STAS domain-containing protein n=1 Tax=hydrothermal vent metagenome TaxID=652676 RepID=A0A1W1EL58_9ZZZZ
MNIIMKCKDNIAFIEIFTEYLDNEKAKEVKRRVFDIIDNSTSKIVLNLSSIKFMDSIALTLIVAILKRINSVNGELKFSPLAKQPEDLLNIIQLDRLLTFISVDEFQKIRKI